MVLAIYLHNKTERRRGHRILFLLMDKQEATVLTSQPISSSFKWHSDIIFPPTAAYTEFLVCLFISYFKK